MTIKIDTDIPLPEAPTKMEIPLGNMRVGNSVFVEGETAVSVNPTIQRFRKKCPEQSFTARTRKEGGVQGVRIWRTE